IGFRAKHFLVENKPHQMKTGFVLIISVLLFTSAYSQRKLTVIADKPVASIAPTMWGAFFEDINFGADGGLYAELVKNGSFEFPEPMLGWFKISPSLAKGDITVETEKPVRENSPHYVRIASKAGAPLGISNEGFRGM